MNKNEIFYCETDIFSPVSLKLSSYQIHMYVVLKR